MLSKDRSPRSESICLVERSSSCDTGSNARLAMKGSVQQSSVNRPVDFEHVSVIPGPGSGLMTGTRSTPGDSDQVMLSKDRSPRSESICLVERSSSCDTGSNAWLAMKGSVQQSSVNRLEDSEHVPVIPGPGSGLMTGTRYPVSGTLFHRPLLVNRVL